MTRGDVRTLAALSRWNATERPDRVALAVGGRELTFRVLDRRANQVARALLDAGLGGGARIAVLAKDDERSFELLFGAAKAGAVTLGLNWRLKEPELAFILRDAGARALFVGADQLEVARRLVAELEELDLVVVLGGGAGDWPDYAAWRDARDDRDPGGEPDPEDVVVQMYTSGTTGLPKGVQLANRSFFAVVRSMQAAGDAWIGWGEADTSLHNIPLFHIGGLWWAITSLDAGAKLVVMDTFVAWRAVELLVQQRVTKACMVPAMIQMVLSEPASRGADFSALGHLVYGGSPIPESLLLEGMETFGCAFAQIYGLTETGNTAVCLRPEDHVAGHERLKAAGRPYPGVELKVIDAEGNELPAREVGEVCIRSPANMVGYWARPDATAETLRDGWVHTGDAGYLDEEGFVYIHDRVKDMIIYAGENIYPAEVENALASHPAVLEVAVIGVPDERWGEAVKAVVVPRENAEVKPRELIAHARERLAEFKLPRSVDFAESLPRTPSGKVQKGVLREPYWQGRERNVN